MMQRWRSSGLAALALLFSSAAFAAEALPTRYNIVLIANDAYDGEFIDRQPDFQSELKLIRNNGKLKSELRNIARTGARIEPRATYTGIWEAKTRRDLLNADTAALQIVEANWQKDRVYLTGWRRDNAPQLLDVGIDEGSLPKRLAEISQAFHLVLIAEEASSAQVCGPALILVDRADKMLAALRKDAPSKLVQMAREVRNTCLGVTR